MRDRVAVYGDSFATPGVNGHGDYPELDQSGWPNLLKEWYDVDCFGKGGSSIYYSYMQFLKSYKNYDKIVFLITNSQRWYTPINVDGNEYFFNAVDSIDVYLKYNKVKNFLDLEKLKSLKRYYLELVDEQVCNDINRAFLEIIKNRCEQENKKLILIHNCNVSGFSDDVPDLVVTNNYYELFWKNYFKNLDDFNVNYEEKRCICHMSETMNKILANDIHQALETGIWNPTLPTSVPHHEPLEYYFTRRR